MELCFLGRCLALRGLDSCLESGMFGLRVDSGFVLRFVSCVCWGAVRFLETLAGNSEKRGSAGVSVVVGPLEVDCTAGRVPVLHPAQGQILNLKGSLPLYGVLNSSCACG